AAGAATEPHELPADCMDRFISVAQMSDGLGALADSGAERHAPRWNAEAHREATHRALIAPPPGRGIALEVAEGEAVEEGQRLMVLEAMKMEHALTAPCPGTVRELAVTPGAQVEVEQQLARVEKAGD